MNYIKAADVQKLLVDPKQTLLSKRGSALLDDRSNMMFVKDTPSRLDDVGDDRQSRYAGSSGDDRSQNR